MDRAQQEIAAIEQTVNEASENNLRELDDLQLTLASGGCGDPILA